MPYAACSAYRGCICARGSTRPTVQQMSVQLHWLHTLLIPTPFPAHTDIARPHIRMEAGTSHDHAKRLKASDDGTSEGPSTAVSLPPDVSSTIVVPALMSPSIVVPALSPRLGMSLDVSAKSSVPDLKKKCKVRHCDTAKRAVRAVTLEAAPQPIPCASLPTACRNCF
jgi:hypothetical protein